MSVHFQIILGSTLLVICLLIHLGIQVWVARKLRSYKDKFYRPSGRTVFLTCSAVVIVLLFSHTVQLYIWALSLWLLGALPGNEEPIYFSLVTYTTVGYGDVTLGPSFRIFGAMASVTGILAFGLTTAFLVGLFPNVIVSLRDDPNEPPPTT
ncbi:MAG: ion channel [Roseobacter sp.]